MYDNDIVLENENIQKQLSDALTKLHDFQSMTNNIHGNSANLEKENETLRYQLNEARIEFNRVNTDRKFLLNQNLELRGKILVFCRLRPALENEEQLEKVNYNVLPNQKLEICEF